MRDGRPIRMKDTFPEDVEKTVLRQRWAKKHEISELKKGVWFEPIKAPLERKPNRIWTTRYAAQARGRNRGLMTLIGPIARDAESGKKKGTTCQMS